MTDRENMPPLPDRAALDREIAELRRKLSAAEEMKRRRDHHEWLAYQRQRADAIRSMKEES